MPNIFGRAATPASGSGRSAGLSGQQMKTVEPVALYVPIWDFLAAVFFAFGRIRGSRDGLC